MGRKAKFDPEVTRIKLNPEQAVLACSCSLNGKASGASNTATGSYFTPCGKTAGKINFCSGGTLANAHTNVGSVASS